MRFNSSLFLQQSVARGGAILEGDGEISLPPVQQPTIIIGSPLFSATDPLLEIQRGSFIVGRQLLRAGVQPAISATMPIFGAGLWYLDIDFRLISIPGVTDFSKNDSISLIDPAGVVMPLVNKLRTAPNPIVPHTATRALWLSFAADGWFLRADLPATTGAADLIELYVSLLATKVL